MLLSGEQVAELANFSNGAIVEVSHTKGEIFIRVKRISDNSRVVIWRGGRVEYAEEIEEENNDNRS